MRGRRCSHLGSMMAAATVLVAGSARADVLFGATAGGTLIRINTQSGSGSPVGPIGVGVNAMASDSQNRLFVGGGGDPDEIILVDPVTGEGSVFVKMVNRPPGYGLRGMAFHSSDTLYIAFSQPDTQEIDLLASMNMTTGVVTVIGETGVTDIQGLAFDASDNLYWLGTGFGGRLGTLNINTGDATVIGGTGLTGNDQALEFE